MANDKKVEQAIAFLNEIKAMDPDDLNSMIDQMVGKEMSDFLVKYAEFLLGSAESEEEMLASACSYIMMGYLLRCGEEQSAQRPPDGLLN